MPTPPKLDPARGHRGRGPLKLPSEGRKGAPPKWPLPDRATAAERSMWVDLWASPQAVAWERLGWTRTVGRYCRLAVLAEASQNAALHAQVTALEDRLGLTPKAMRLLLWEVTVDEVAQQRESAGARGRIRAVG